MSQGQPPPARTPNGELSAAASNRCFHPGPYLLRRWKHQAERLWRSTWTHSSEIHTRPAAGLMRLHSQSSPSRLQQPVWFNLLSCAAYPGQIPAHRW